jgi:hypothetical protein
MDEKRAIHYFRDSLVLNSPKILDRPDPEKIVDSQEQRGYSVSKLAYRDKEWFMIWLVIAIALRGRVG